MIFFYKDRNWHKKNLTHVTEFYKDLVNTGTGEILVFRNHQFFHHLFLVRSYDANNIKPIRDIV